MSARSDAAVTAAGLVLAAALVGLPIGAHLARRYLATPITATPAKPYSQSDAVATSISKLKGAGK
jgi:hypothetical protein